MGDSGLVQYARATRPDCGRHSDRGVIEGKDACAWVRARATLALAGIVLLWTAANFFRIKADPLKLQDLLLGYPVMTAGASALLIAVLCSRPILGKSQFVYLGRISYGLYVFHVLGLMCSDYLMPNFKSSAGRLALHNLVG